MTKGAKDIKSCPFCGYSAYYRIVRDRSRESKHHDGFYYRVRCECSVCHSLGESVKFGPVDKPLKLKGGFQRNTDASSDAAVAAAKEKWNTRRSL